MDELSEIRKILKELAESQKERDKEFDKINKEWDDRFKESREAWERGLKESREAWERELRENREAWERELRENREAWEREFRESRKAWDEDFRKSKREWATMHKETEKMIKELSKNIGGLGNTIGKIPEAMSLPKIEEEFAEFGILVHEVHPNVVVRDGAKIIKEIDLMLPGVYKDKRVIVVMETQVQYRSEREVDKFETFIRDEFKRLIEGYKGYGVVGCLCALSYGTGIESYTQSKGIFVMRPKKKLVGIVNPKDFKFKIYEG